MLNIEIRAVLEGKKVMVHAFDVMSVVATWNRHPRVPAEHRLRVTYDDRMVTTLVDAVLRLPSHLQATVSFGHA